MALEVKRYKKRPEFIETVQVTKENFKEVGEFIGANQITVEYFGDDLRITFLSPPPNGRSITVVPGDFIYVAEGELTRDVAQITSANLKKMFKRI